MIKIFLLLAIFIIKYFTGSDGKSCEHLDDKDCPNMIEKHICNDPIAAVYYCPNACNLCDMTDLSYRCQRNHLNITDIPVVFPYQLNGKFDNIIINNKDNYKINVLSNDPWIVTVDDFLNDIEINTFAELMQGKLNPESNMREWRTSSNGWCNENCKDDPIIQNLTNKIAKFISISSDHYEYFQILQYEEGEYYSKHHDYIEGEQNKCYGPRIITFLMYFNDVEAGGETYFTDLDIIVKPKKGKALFWSNVLKENPTRPDLRTLHESKPVIKGVKYVANKWIHLYNYMKPFDWGCTG